MSDNKNKDSQYEGRDRYFVDVDRMINEGLGGGTVNDKENSGLIGETHDFSEEEPPHKIEG